MTQRRRRRLTRRRFLSLIAAGSAAAATASVRTLAQAAPAAPARKPTVIPSLSPKIQKEIDKQKGFVAAALKTIRNYPLPAGSDMAFVFQPMRPRRKRG